MQELKQAIAELNITYGKVSELIGSGHAVSKQVLHIIKTHSTDNAHQIVMEKMGQKKVQFKGRGVEVVAGKN